MTITANTFNLKALPMAGKEWQVSLQSEDLSGCESIKAAETGYTHFLTYLHLRADAAMDISIGSGESGNAVITVHLGPIPLDAASGFILWKAPKGMGLKCTINLALTVDSSASGTVWIEAHGLTTQNRLDR